MLRPFFLDWRKGRTVPSCEDPSKSLVPPPEARAPFEERNLVHPVNGEVPPVKGRPRKLPHYANRGKTSSSGGELASARSCFSTVRTALGKLRITGLLAQFDVARSFPQFPRPLLLQPTILTSERGTRFGIRKAPNQVPPPHLPDDPETSGESAQIVLLSRSLLETWLPFCRRFKSFAALLNRQCLAEDRRSFGTWCL